MLKGYSMLTYSPPVLLFMAYNNALPNPLPPASIEALCDAIRRLACTECNCYRAQTEVPDWEWVPYDIIATHVIVLPHEMAALAELTIDDYSLR